MEHSITRIALEKIKELGFITLDSFFPKKYTRAESARKLFGLDSMPKISPRTFSSLLSRLKHEGIIERVSLNKKSGWRLTPKGEKWMGQAYEDKKLELPKPDGIQRLVIFDIPEREREKRDTIRTELIASGFKQLQKSVWIAERPLSKEFITTLDNLNVYGKVHIFTIQKKGTLN